MTTKTGQAIFISIAGLVVLSFQACSPTHQDSEENLGDASFALETPEGQASQTIFNKNCASCHNSSNAPGGVGSLAEVGVLIQSGVIIPGNANDSILVKSLLRNTNFAPMPPANSLSNTDIDKIRNWILQIPKSSVTTTSVSQPPTTQGQPPSTVPDFVSFAADILPILNNRCNTCHDSTSANGNVVLDNYQDVSQQVDSGNAITSLLYQVISGSNPSMPSNGNKLSSIQVQTIQKWINDGALDN